MWIGTAGLILFHLSIPVPAKKLKLLRCKLLDNSYLTIIYFDITNHLVFIQIITLVAS